MQGGGAWPRHRWACHALLELSMGTSSRARNSLDGGGWHMCVRPIRRQKSLGACLATGPVRLVPVFLAHARFFLASGPAPASCVARHSTPSPAAPADPLNG